MSFRAVDVIARKRAGLELTAEEIDSFVGGFSRGEIPDYQAAAWLMAVCWRGMTARETAELTLAIVRSGETLDLGPGRAETVDKHSTGGVGDKTTLVVAPLVAALGLRVGKMSGRGLGFSGGTLDKLESIAGFRVELTRREFLRQLDEVGIVVAGQSAELAPADGKLYALRDVTATVESIPLIASSIMSKKIAAGAPTIVLDVKVGRGAFMKTEADARALGEAMVAIGERLRRRTRVVLSSMEQPLGYAIGNALEVAEAVATLRGEGPTDLVALCAALAGELLHLAGRAPDPAAGRATAETALRDGRALAKLEALVAAQGGDVAMVRDRSLLPRAPVARDVVAPRDGYVAAVDAEALARAAVDLGAGRAVKADPIDPAVGLVLRRKVGDPVRRGDPLATVHARATADADRAAPRVLAAFTLSDTRALPPPLILGTI